MPTEVKALTGKSVRQIIGGMYKTIVVAQNFEKSTKQHQTLYEILGLPFSEKFIGSKLPHSEIVIAIDVVCNLDIKDSLPITSTQGQLYISSSNVCFYSQTFEEVTKVSAKLFVTFSSFM